MALLLSRTTSKRRQPQRSSLNGGVQVPLRETDIATYSDQASLKVLNERPSFARQARWGLDGFYSEHIGSDSEFKDESGKTTL